MLEYQKKLKDVYQINDLSDDALDAAFVAKAKELHQKIENKSISEEEIREADQELVELFDELHEIEEVDDPKVTELQTQNTILKGKEAASAANTIEDLQKIAEEYKQFPEVVEVCNSKIEAIQKKSQAENELQQKVSGIKTIEELQEFAKELDDKNPKVVEIVNARINELKAEKEGKSKSIKEKLLSQPVWSYDQLRAIGINPTGDDMVVEGVKLLRKYMFKAYEVVKP